MSGLASELPGSSSSTVASLLVSRLHSRLADFPLPFQWHQFAPVPQGRPNMEFIQHNKGAAGFLSLALWRATSPAAAWKYRQQGRQPDLADKETRNCIANRINMFPPWFDDVITAVLPAKSWQGVRGSICVISQPVEVEQQQVFSFFWCSLGDLFNV